MIDKVKAIELREQGLSYKDIASELGCSIDWCKQNLKAVSKNTQEKKLIKSLSLKAKSRQGITTGEILKELRTIQPNDFSKEQKVLEDKAMKRLKDNLGKEPKALVRPYWMKPEDARLSLKLVLQAVNAIDERLYEYVNEIRQELNLDESYIKSLSYVINRLTFAGSAISPEPTQNFLDRMEKITNELEERNKDVPKVVYDSYCAEVKNPVDLSDIDHLIY